MGHALLAAQLGLLIFGSLSGCQSEALIDLHSNADAGPDAATTGSATDSGETNLDAATKDAGLIDAGPPSEALVLRYDFAGDGTVVTDRVGDRDGEIAGGGALNGAGQLVMDGVDDHVVMPQGLFEGRSEVTFMAWVTWTGNRCWERIVDIGFRDQSTDWMPPVGALFVTALRCGHESVAAYIEVDRNMYSVRQGWPLPLDVQSHVAVTVADDAPNGSLHLYVNGALVAEGPMPYALSSLPDDQAFLGRSLWSHDPYFQGTFEEFRMYGRALRDDEVLTAFEAGPDAL